MMEQWQIFAVDDETAFNAFMRINIHRFYNDLDPILYPPGVD